MHNKMSPKISFIYRYTVALSFLKRERERDFAIVPDGPSFLTVFMQLSRSGTVNGCDTGRL